MTEYTLTRSKRKTIGLYIKGGILEIRAPLKCPQSEIDRLITEKENWITTKLAKSKKQTEQKQSFALNYGDTIIFRGENYPLIEKAGSRAGFDGESFYVPPKMDSDLIISACVKIYTRLAKIHLAERVEVFAKQMMVSPTAVKVNSAKGRWGSCSNRKSLNFSWRLIMADDDVIDYVVVHELAHIIEMNHSAKFWAIVENVLPDYMERKSRLRKLQKRLSTENWG